MQPVFLSDEELYFTQNIIGEEATISGDEFHHIVDVMRHKVGDIIFITDGKGNIHKAEIISISKKNLTAKTLSSYYYENKLSGITFCIPRLRSNDRFDFALEKCVELGFTNFIVYDSKRTVAKGEKIERWQKILLSAMKQSLRAWLPNVSYCNNINDIILKEGKKYIFDQNADVSLLSLINSEVDHLSLNNCFLIFGPEGGIDNGELKTCSPTIGSNNKNVLKIKLTDNRLRSETAIITAASIIAISLTQ